MKKIGLIFLIGLLFTSTAFAEVIDLSDDSFDIKEESILDDEVLSMLNDNSLVHSFIDDYETIKVIIDETNYKVTIKDNSVYNVVIEKDIIDYDYYIKLSFNDLIKTVMDKKSLIKVVYNNPQIPLKVLMRVAGILMN